MMDKIEQHQHLLHAELPSFARKLEVTRQLIEEGLAKIARPYLAFSGGIDSTVLLDLLWQAGFTMPVLWGDDGADYPETLAFLAATEERYGFRLTRIRCMGPWRSWCLECAQPQLGDDPEALAAWLNPHEWNETWESLQQAYQHGYTGVFLGMLAKESRSRQYALESGYKTLYQVKSEAGMWHCSPLAAWEKRDIWAYIVSRHLPYNPCYDTLAALRVPLSRRRVAPLTCFRTMQYGSVTLLRQGWPDLYNRLAATFPAVRAYA